LLFLLCVIGVVVVIAIATGCVLTFASFSPAAITLLQGHCFGDEHMLGDEWDGAEEPDDARNVLDSADANGFANGVVQTVHSNAS
jgi:hypothetical protein